MTETSRWRRLAEATSFALAIHAEQTRKGTDTPYVSHLLGVASLVLENGGDEEQAIAALLHDAVEDQGAHQEAVIRERFGPRVAAIVLGCTDAETLPKPPWRARKETYIEHLEHADPDVLLVSCADKVHNARAICTDLRTHGSSVFERFRGGRDGTLWYYATLADAFGRLLPSPIARELAVAVEDMHRLSYRGDGEPAAIPRPGISRRHDFEAHLTKQCERLAAERLSVLVEEVRASASKGEAWRTEVGPKGSSNFWDEYSVVLAEDDMTFPEASDDRMRGICRAVIGGLSAIERDVLERCTETFFDYFDPSRTESTGEERARWLLDELLQAAQTEAIDHGWDLKDGDDDEEDEAEAADEGDGEPR